MKLLTTILAITLILFSTSTLNAQINEGKLGAWFSYFFVATIKESSWGVNVELQYRNCNVVGDLVQLLTRTVLPSLAKIRYYDKPFDGVSL